jgi:hypothetical protein
MCTGQLGAVERLLKGLLVAVERQLKVMCSGQPVAVDRLLKGDV